MARRKTNHTGWILAGGAALAALLYYVKEGAGSAQDAALIPDSIEEKLDRVVDALNERFGKRWVDRGLAALERGLSSVLPTPLVALVSAVHQAEQWAKQQRNYGRMVTGSQKRSYATSIYASA